MSAGDYFDDICTAINSNSIPDLVEVIGDITESQLSLETVLNHVNSKKQTVLHLASAQLLDEFVRILLHNGINPNYSDVEGRTPVCELLANLREHCQCESCIRKAVRCIRYLGEFGGDMNECDKMGQSPLQASAFIGKDVSMELLKQGASLQAGNSKKNIMTTLLEQLPDIILPIFDRAIAVDFQQSHSRDFQLTIDMSVIVPTHTNCNLERKCWGKSPAREMAFLRQILQASVVRNVDTYRAILQHPLVHVFTDIKWNHLRIMYFGYLLFQVNLVFWYVVFLFLVIFVDCEPTLGTVGNNGTSGISFKDRWFHSKEAKCDIQIYTKVIGAHVLFCTILSAGKELYNLATDFRSYVTDAFNPVHWIGIGTMAATTIITLDPIAFFEMWLFPLASFGVGICWFQLFLHLGEIPSLAIYVDMFSKVTANFCISLLMYSPILIAFGMSYYMVFPSDTKLIEIPVTALRMLTMMLGELNFETLFSPSQWIRNPYLAYIWYAIFLVVISMVMMNLLVGLAVNDIGGCRKDSELVMMQRKIRYLNYLEKSFYLGTLFTPKRLKAYLRNRVNVVRPMNSKCGDKGAEEEIKKNSAIIIFPNKPKDARFHEITSVAIRQWLNRKGSSGKRTDTFCHRDQSVSNVKPAWRRQTPEDAETKDRGLKKKRVTVFPNGQGIEQAQDVRIGSSISAKSKMDDSKKLAKMEKSLTRLETRVLDLTAKLDDVLRLVSNSAQRPDSEA